MKKLVLFLAVIAMTSVSFVSCGNKTSNSDKPVTDSISADSASVDSVATDTVAVVK